MNKSSKGKESHKKDSCRSVNSRNAHRVAGRSLKSVKCEGTGPREPKEKR